MKCVGCGGNLTTGSTGIVEIDYCTACGGTWFDKDEIESVDAPAEPIPQDLPVDESKLTVKPLSFDFKENGARSCPKCGDGVLCRNLFGVSHPVEVEQCLTCSGIWLDGGELKRIRDQYPDDRAREEAFQAWANSKLAEVTDKIEAKNSALKAEIEAAKNSFAYKFSHAISSRVNFNS